MSEQFNYTSNTGTYDLADQILNSQGIPETMGKLRNGSGAGPALFQTAYEMARVMIKARGIQDWIARDLARDIERGRVNGLMNGSLARDLEHCEGQLHVLNTVLGAAVWGYKQEHGISDS